MRAAVSMGARLYLGEGISRSEQNILWFQVTVNDVFKVQMPQRNQNLPTQEYKQDIKAAKSSYAKTHYSQVRTHKKLGQT